MIRCLIDRRLQTNSSAVGPRWQPRFDFPRHTHTQVSDIYSSFWTAQADVLQTHADVALSNQLPTSAATAASYRPSTTWFINRIIFQIVCALHEAEEHAHSCLETTVTTDYRVGQLKWGQLTFLMVTFECIGKMQWFLAHVNYTQQEVVRCKF